jgi:hypothetical protein
MAGRLRRGLGMSEFEMVAAARLDAYPAAAAGMTEAGDGWFGTVMAGKAARLAVTAWLMAVNGDGSALAAMADGDAAHWLLNPVREEWVIAAGPLVTEIVISGVDPAADPPELRVTWRFTGRQRIEPALGPGDAVPWDWTDGEQIFAGLLTLELTGSGASPWRLTHGHVETLDAHLGYTFVSRFETPEEYRRRTGTSAGAGVLVPTDTYLLDAGFAEHDEKFGSSARLEVSSDPAPTREEAEKLIWPAIWAETHRALGEGEWRPSLGWLDMIRLLGPPPAGDAG